MAFRGDTSLARLGCKTFYKAVVNDLDKLLLVNSDQKDGTNSVSVLVLCDVTTVFVSGVTAVNAEREPFVVFRITLDHSDNVDFISVRVNERKV